MGKAYAGHLKFLIVDWTATSKEHALFSNFSGDLFKEITLAKMLTKVDFLISAAHFTGHAFAGPGGAIKNIGVGCAGKPAKD